MPPLPLTQKNIGDDMSKFEVKIPKMGQSTVEVELIAWRVAVGDTVNIGTPLAEVESEKATVEIESEVAGTISELLVAEGDAVEVGSTICIVEVA